MFIDACRLKTHPALSDLDDAQAVRLARAACGAVENYCNRKFATAAYDEFYPATNARSLFLNQYPVRSVAAVRASQVQAVQVQNTNTAAQAATVQTTAAGLVLTVTANAVSSPNTLTWATYPTLGQLVTAINGLGVGWVASVNGPFAGWASSDLGVYQTTQSARQATASLAPHYQYLSGYTLNAATGELTTAAGWYGSGPWAYRIQYTAGFDTIPEELIAATVELAAATYSASKADPNLVSEALGGYSYTRAASKSLADLSTAAYQTLRYFRKPNVPFFKVP